MCLLDEVLEWDAQQIRCRASSHRAADNPLRAHGRLGAACGVEYAAQAMAIHGALVAGAAGTRPAGAAQAGPPGAPPIGYLASVRGVNLFAQRLDDLHSDLIAWANRMSSDSTTVLYEFAISCGERTLLEGRATIVFVLDKSTGPASP